MAAQYHQNKSDESANSRKPVPHIFAIKNMKKQILFSSKNWKHELRKNIEAERSRATTTEKEIQEEIQFLQDEIADAFTEINEERKRTTAEIQRSTSNDEQMQKSIDATDGKIKTETTRAQTAESKLRSCTPVRFDSILTTAVPLTDEAPDYIESIVYCVPLARFVAYSPSGHYYSSWENTQLYMNGSTIHKDKIYICGGKLYIWNGKKLADITEDATSQIEQLIQRISTLEAMVK